MHNQSIFLVYGKNETFLTEEDYLRPLDDQEIIQLTEEDFKNAEKFEDEIVGNKSKRHVLSQQKYYRGDIRGKAAWGSKSKEGVRRNGVTAIIKKWPNGRIPYVLSAQYNERERAVLARAFQEYHGKTCGRQELSLDDGCLQYDTAVHELMHSVGFYHEHERWDRDKFIQIMWHNIDRDAYDQFGKVDLTESSYYGQPYDYQSIMHYDSMAFSKNGFETLIARTPEMTAVIGSAIDFSPVDLVKIRQMYQCPTTEMGDMGVFSSLLNQPQAPPPPPAAMMPPPPPQPHPAAPASAFLANEGLSSEPCVDKTTLCWRWLDRCQSFFFEKIMREFCALSCGYCTPNSGAMPANPSGIFPPPPPPPPPPILPPVPIVPPSAQLFNRDISSISLNAGSVVPEEQPYYLRFG
uniref:Metalloendopeptidase n=1 Tax=Panagrolaimus sp. PS1159 TaxID=55785 RepID=A0AC35F6Y8_9BILA